jgi:hypothetical protein
MTALYTFTLAGHDMNGICTTFKVVRQINSVADIFTGKFVKNRLDAVHVPAEGDVVIVSYATGPSVVGQFYGYITALPSVNGLYTITAQPLASKANFAYVTRSYTTATNHDVIMSQLLLDAGISNVPNSVTVHQSVGKWRTSNQLVSDEVTKLSFMSKGTTGSAPQTIFMASPSVSDTAIVCDMGAVTPNVPVLSNAAGNIVGNITRDVITDERINSVITVHSAGSKTDNDGTGGTRSILLNYPELSSDADAALVNGTYLAIYKGSNLTQYRLKVPASSLYNTTQAYTPLNSIYSLNYQGTLLAGVCVKHTVNWPSMVDEIVLGDYYLDINRYLSQQAKATNTMARDWAGGALAFKGRMAAGTWTVPAGNNPIPFDSEEYDLSDSFNTSTGQFVAPIAGIYLITWAITVNMTSGAGVSFLQSQNGTTVGFDNLYNVLSGTENHPYKGSLVLKIAKGEYFEIRAQNLSGTNIIVGGNTYNSQITGNLIVPL